jgi:membrane associated rhomboid family serine protease
MFVPVHDDAPHRVIRVQWITFAIIAINFAIFMLTASGGEQELMAAAAGFGIVPGELTSQIDLGAALNPVPEPATLVTYQFLHAGWMHIVSNMLFLWVFADNVEDAYGHAGFPFFYLLTGIAGGLVHVMMLPGSPNPLIGASGAVSGVIAAYVVLFPRAKVWVLFGLLFLVRLPALLILGFWFLLQLYSLWKDRGGEIEVAWWAHIGGFLAGLALTVALRPRLMRSVA